MSFHSQSFKQKTTSSSHLDYSWKSPQPLSKLHKSKKLYNEQFGHPSYVDNSIHFGGERSERKHGSGRTTYYYKQLKPNVMKVEVMEFKQPEAFQHDNHEIYSMPKKVADIYPDPAFHQEYGVTHISKDYMMSHRRPMHESIDITAFRTVQLPSIQY